MHRSSVLIGCAVLLGLQILTAGKGLGAEELARLHRSGGLIAWLPQIDSEEILLRLSGPDGQVRSLRFEAGAVPSLALFGEAGQPLPDGLYTYELRATPRLSRDLRERLRAARAEGDEPAVRALQAEIPGPLVQSGTFRIAGGEILAGESAESEAGARLKDQMVPDDLIVDGKGCIGLGCSNGESFGGEALRLKQSLVRLRFEDTSAAAGFSTRDWMIAINDPGSGGGDRFSIEDVTAGRAPFTLRGNAPADALVIDSSGKLGLRTATPAQDAHLVTGNTPTIRLEQSTSGGLAARTWDVGANENHFFVRDVTGGATGSFNLLANGDAGIGTSTPAERLHVFENADANTIITVENPGTGLASAGVLRSRSNSATVNFQAHGSGRTLSRFGQPLASWAEFLQVTGNGLIIGTLADKPLILGTASVDRIHIASSGNVGIGVSSPASRLHVDGDVRVQGGSFIDDGTTLNVPDYVFDPGYPLMPIEELRDFVARERHLPNVPSAEEIRENGLNLSQFQTRLLEKIEELTLYTLTQHKEIAALKDENARLEARMEALERGAAATAPAPEMRDGLRSRKD